MSDKINALLVVLENDIQKEEAEALLGAIRQLRGVLGVSANVADTTAHIAQERARHDLAKNMWKVLFPT